MPHVGSGGDDLASTDEIKVFKEEGDEEDNRSSENLTELKTSLVTEGEEEKSSDVSVTNDYGSPSKNTDCRPDSASHSGKSFDLLPPHSAPIGYVVSPYAHPHNGALGPVSMDIFPEGFSKSTMYQLLRDCETRHTLEMARNIDDEVKHQRLRNFALSSSFNDLRTHITTMPNVAPLSPRYFLFFVCESFRELPPQVLTNYQCSCSLVHASSIFTQDMKLKRTQSMGKGCHHPRSEFGSISLGDEDGSVQTESVGGPPSLFPHSLLEDVACQFPY
ncbi:hypothetical protein JTE90_007515 [Oedothorax gibbosus]|uniref:CTNNB1 binding N-teminal domain-containing protein n=1 Tax=Oedothorax gibbosus TaxID=931172 RepID=A0AAV6VN77_9ARAC|nr:hypothetical protein JTE90_007515 [Oedothorax gibbosus]